MSDKPLPIRHHRFVQEYLKDGNATQAYIRAGYSRTRSAQSSASRLLTQPHVAAAVAAGRRRLARALDARDHRKPENPGLTAWDRELYEKRCRAYERALNHRRQEQQRLEWELGEAHAALAEAQATIHAAGLAAAPGPRDPARALRPIENHRDRR